MHFSYIVAAFGLRLNLWQNKRGAKEKLLLKSTFLCLDGNNRGAEGVRQLEPAHF